MITMNLNSLIRYYESTPENTELTFSTLTKYLGVSQANGSSYMGAFEDWGIVELIKVERDKNKVFKHRYTEIYRETELGRQLRPLILRMMEHRESQK